METRILREDSVRVLLMAAALWGTVIAIAAPWIEPYSTTQQVGPVYGAPNARHLLGLDDGGIDMLSEVIAGARVSMLVGFASALVAMIIVTSSTP